MCTRSSTTARRFTSTSARALALAVLALAIAARLVYTQVWGTGGGHPLPWTDLTHKMGTIEFTRRVEGVYHSRGAFERLLEATMPGRVTKLSPVPAGATGRSS